MIIVLAGTSEGREICSLLQGGGWPVLASVTSSWGQELLHRQGVTNIVQGNLGREGLLDLIDQVGAELIIDATHPFAVAISQDAMAAARQSGIEYLRVQRPPANVPDHPLIRRITALEELESHLQLGHRLFSTLGSKHLAVIMPIIRRNQAEIIARVLPSSSILKNCEVLGLQPGQLIAMQGPFSVNLNLEMFRQYAPHLIITKESGSPGGLEAKVEAALQLAIPIIIWSRPELIYPVCFDSVQALLAYINREERDRR